MGLPLSYHGGDNRGLNPTGGSYRAYQQITLGLGGVQPPTSGTQNTGTTHIYALDSLDTSGHISAAAKQT